MEQTKPGYNFHDSAVNVIGEKYYVNVTQFIENILPRSMNLPATTVWDMEASLKTLGLVNHWDM